MVGRGGGGTEEEEGPGVQMVKKKNSDGCEVTSGIFSKNFFYLKNIGNDNCLSCKKKRKWAIVWVIKL